MLNLEANNLNALKSSKEMTEKVDSLKFDFHLFPDRQGNACGFFYLDDTLTTSTKRLFMVVSLE